jgi:ATP-dependent protease ClpP protease subunit
MSEMVEVNVIGTFNAALENKFNKDIQAVKSGDLLIIDITSNGGDMEVLTRMTAKILALKENGVQVLTFVPEYANSAGFFLFLLGDDRDMEETATVHYHPPRVKLSEDFVGTKNNLEGVMESLNKYQEFTNSLFRASCEIDDELFSLLENSELPMTRKHLISLGIIN